MNVSLWMGLFAPARTPKALVDRVNREAGAVLQKTEAHDGLVAQGVAPQPTTPEGLAAHVTAEIAKRDRVVKSSGIKTD
jgi:tripartite-type tricarboxylate transporter receptor subunit TctC